MESAVKLWNFSVFLFCADDGVEREKNNAITEIL